MEADGLPNVEKIDFALVNDKDATIKTI